MYSLLLAIGSFFTFMELNCENLFDCYHDSLKNDYEYLPTGNRRWTPKKYWHKVNSIAKVVIACSPSFDNDTRLPDLVALCEVENDTVMTALTKRSLLRNAHYRYLMTNSEDQRGIDVALLYRETFTPIRHYPLRIKRKEDMRPTRDILYVSGTMNSHDTLHIFVLHAPSRLGGEMKSRPFRMAVAQRLCESTDSITAINPDANIIIAGDFNDYAGDAPLRAIATHNLHDATAKAKGKNGAKGTYRYKGRWGSLDHIFVSETIRQRIHSVYINDMPFLTEDDKTHGGRKPCRTYNGPKYQRNGFSDHLPLVMNINIQEVKGQVTTDKEWIQDPY